MKLSALFEQALQLAPGARAQWLQELATHSPEGAHQLIELLANDAAAEATIAPAAMVSMPELVTAAGLSSALIGGFRLLKPIGRGGMGEVWLAERAAGGALQRVALKLLLFEFAGQDNETQRRFLDEQRIVGTLEHPCVARLIDAGRTPEGLPWIAIEYVDGAPITVWCDQQQLDVRARVQMFLKVLDAVHHAHQNLIVHRDLKPGNILVGSQGIPKLLDFGIAKNLLNETNTATAQRFFSLGAAAPEQLLGERITVATDVYQLGTLLYELLCGGLPHQISGPSPGEIQEDILNRAPDLPSHKASDRAARERGLERSTQLARILHGDLDRIVLHALRKRPSERYQSTIEFSQDLQAWLAGRPVRAVGQGRWYRASKFLRRHRWAVAAAGGAVMILLLLVALLLRRDVQLTQARLEALTARDAAALDRDKSRAVNAFLLDMFRAANPTIQGKYDLKEIVLNAIRVQLEQGSFATDPSTAFALIDAALGIGAEREAAAFLNTLDLNKQQFSGDDLRTLLMLEAKSASLAADRPRVQALLNALAPMMQGAPEQQRYSYLAYLGQSLLDQDPARVLQITAIDPLPPSMIRLRARAFLALERIPEATALLEEARKRTDLGSMERLAVLHGLVTSYLATQRTEDALAQSTEMIKLSDLVLGAENSRAFPYRNSRALALAAAGRYVEAIAILDAVLASEGSAKGDRLFYMVNRAEFGSALAVPDTITLALTQELWKQRYELGEGGRARLLLAVLRICFSQQDLGLAAEQFRALDALGVDTTGHVQSLLELWREWLFASSKRRKDMRSQWLRQWSAMHLVDPHLQTALQSIPAG